jgi:NitT/TauT family transport system ATP-binding protein/nitrate/nitrite transport system substrate-binding protein
MTAALAKGGVDGFCAGAPWGAVAAASGVGRTAAVSSEILPDHAEKCLAVRRGWAEASPTQLQALLRALIRAGRACDDPACGPGLALLLARPEWVGVPAALIGPRCRADRRRGGPVRFRGPRRRPALASARGLFSAANAAGASDSPYSGC